MDSTTSHTVPSGSEIEFDQPTFEILEEQPPKSYNELKDSTDFAAYFDAMPTIEDVIEGENEVVTSEPLDGILSESAASAGVEMLIKPNPNGPEGFMVKRFMKGEDGRHVDEVFYVTSKEPATFNAATEIYHIGLESKRTTSGIQQEVANATKKQLDTHTKLAANE